MPSSHVFPLTSRDNSDDGTSHTTDASTLHVVSNDLHVVANDTEMVITPHHADVLLGRGATFQRHPGNVRYTELIQQHIDLYFASVDIWAKKLVACRIVDAILADGGRFLKRIESNSPTHGPNMRWTIISKDAARLKVSHAIQYMRRKVLQDASLIQGCPAPPPLQRQSDISTLSPSNWINCNGRSRDDRIDDSWENDVTADGNGSSDGRIDDPWGCIHVDPLEPIRLVPRDSAHASSDNRAPQPECMAGMKRPSDSMLALESVEPNRNGASSLSLLITPRLCGTDGASLSLEQIVLEGRPLWRRATSIGSFDALEVDTDSISILEYRNSID